MHNFFCKILIANGLDAEVGILMKLPYHHFPTMRPSLRADRGLLALQKPQSPLQSLGLRNKTRLLQLLRRN